MSNLENLAAAPRSSTMPTSSKSSLTRSYGDLHPFQDDGIDFIYDHDESQLLVKMGGGKTVMAATAHAELMRDGYTTRTLIVAPKRVALLVWPPEFEIWEHLRGINLAVAVGSPAKRREAFMSSAPFVVVNYDNLVWAEKEGLIKAGKFDGAILDENGFLQNSRAERSKAWQRARKQFRVVTGMTGTPGNITRMYGIVRAVDRGRRLGQSFYSFRQSFFHQTGPMAWQWEENAGALDIVLDRISDMTFLVEPKDYEDQLPKIVATQHFVQLPPKQRKMYAELEKHYIVKSDDNTVVADNAGVRTGKLHQLVQGFLYTHDSAAGERQTWDWHHDEKIDTLVELVESLGGEPAIVAYKFQADLAKLLEKFPDTPYLGSGVSDKASEYAVRQWNERKLPLLFMHPASAAHGLNLQAGGNRVIIYGLTWSLDEYEQLVARLRRQGQTADQVFVDFIAARATVDEDISGALIHKRSVEDAVLAGVLARCGQ